MSQTQTRLYEHLVKAIAQVHQYESPDSLAYKLCSPLLLQSFALPGKHVVNEMGLRVFDSDTSGSKAALYDMELKLNGLSRSKLKPSDTLHNLLGVYRLKTPGDIQSVVDFLRIALEDETITKETQLSRFLEGSK
jgi:hypothetical protein